MSMHMYSTVAKVEQYTPGKIFPKALMQLHHTAVVEVVIVVVADEHEVDVWQLRVIQAQGWLY